MSFVFVAARPEDGVTCLISHPDWVQVLDGR